ncbi:MAG: SHOCT domain-containing protein [Sphingopyxis terrae]|nr:SHOCT domain-containing protein [Sphingopyxis terrae]
MKRTSIIAAYAALLLPLSALSQETAAPEETPAAAPKIDQAQTPTSANSASSAGRLDYGLFRRNSEAAIKADLIDPSSAQIDWPYGFTYGTWKPFLRKRVSGYLTCGRVNAKNRMGGYVGSTAFVVVLDKSGAVIFKRVGDGGPYDLVEGSCQKSVSMLPPPQRELTNRAPSAASGNSIADQLAKLAELKESGALTQEEFEAAKRRLLGSGD